MRRMTRRVAVLVTWLSAAAVPGAAAQPSTPAQQQIVTAERLIATKPAEPDGYNALALAFARRARETSDTKYYEQADKAIDKALQLVPDNFEAKKMRAWVLLGKHEFAAALTLAQELNKRAPDDLLVYGLLTDAHVELGHYKEAEEACQWMLDLRRGNIAAFTRAAYLRELFGDIDGAIELMTAAFERTHASETEDRAWILSQLAHLALLAGHTNDAERLLKDALTLFPNYHYALANLAKLRTAQGDHAEAAVLLKRRYEAAPHPENLYDLAKALDRAGRTADAKVAFEDFERRALRESSGWDNANRELTFYYADHAKRPSEALRIASLEIARRQDVYTLDAYAWALYANDRVREAREHIDRALAVGIKDPEVLSRAAIIAKAAAKEH
jgi:tetratricopeptide (TPR) repeat protein